MQEYTDSTGLSTCLPCQQWSSRAQNGKYLSPCTSTSNFQELDCASCPSGQYSSQNCNGAAVGRVFSGSNVPQCLSCPAGTYSVSASGGLQTSCTQCTTGFYQDRTGQSVCKTCTNALVANSQYQAWGSVVPSSNACPVACNAGFFKRTSPVRCEACAGGTYSNVGATRCLSCTGLPANAQFLPTTRTNKVGYQCVWDCNSGYQKNLLKTACEPCSAGLYSIQARAHEDTPEISCLACSSCATGTSYETRACTPTQNRLCSFCNVTCGEGNYITHACTITSDVQCTPCRTTCDPDHYLVGSCAGNSIQDAVQCEKCAVPSDCQTGLTYLPQSCTGTNRTRLTCVACSQPNCVNGYVSQCSGAQDSRCMAHTTCQSGYYLINYGQFQDGTCAPCTVCPGLTRKNCSTRSDVVCDGLPCSSTSPCPANQFCKFVSESDEGYCAACPSGYGSDGLQCLSCPDLVTCDVLGRVVCKGQLLPFTTGECVDGFVRETGSCPVVQSSLFRVLRGGYLFSDDSNCHPYFECTPGHFPFFSATAAIVQCSPCVGLQANEAYLSRGLQSDSPQSCISDCRYGMDLATEACFPPPTVTYVRSNGPGEFFDGVFMQTCLAGSTSQRSLALSASDCVACEAVPHTIGDLCGSYQCTGAWAKRGSACYADFTCPREGFDELCAPSALPWQQAGFFKEGTASVLAPGTALAEGFLWVRQGVFTQAYKYGISNRHKLFFDARQLTLPGRVCSAAHRDPFVFVAFCEATFLVYYKLSLPAPRPRLLIGRNETGYREDYKTEALFGSELYIAHHPNQPRLFVVDRLNCVLREVAATTPGHYLTRSHLVYGTPNMCFGPDALQWPRGLFPVLGSSFVFFAADDGLYQLHVASMRVRRALSRSDLSQLRNVTAQNTAALHLHFPNSTEIITATQTPCGGGLTSYLGSACAVPCTPGLYYVNRSNGACSPCFTRACRWGEESVECTGESPQYCRACPKLTNAMYFLPGSCSPTNIYYVNPCPKNYFVSGGGCASCPPYSSTAFAGAISMDECRCFEGVQRVSGLCVVGQLYPLPYAPKCPLLTYPRGMQGSCESCRLEPLPTCGAGEYTLSNGSCGNCSFPLNASVTGAGLVGDDPNSCPWSCHVGHYPKNTMPLHARCQPCANIPNHSSAYYSSNGQDDAPNSCLWRCSHPYVRRLQQCVPCDHPGSLPSCRNPAMVYSCTNCEESLRNISGVRYRIFNCTQRQCDFSLSHPAIFDLVAVGPGGPGGDVVYYPATNTSTRGTGGGGAGDVFYKTQFSITQNFQVSRTTSYVMLYGFMIRQGGFGGGGDIYPSGSIGGSGGGAGVGGSPGAGHSLERLNVLLVNKGGLSNSRAGGGGGGAGSVGSNAFQNKGGDGGEGLDISWFVGYNLTVAGGGGGGADVLSANPLQGQGKAGGGAAGEHALPFTGSGGGGGTLYQNNETFAALQPGNGGSGLALMRFVDEECQCVEL